MSAARSGVNAVATSSEPANAPARDLLLMKRLLPLPDRTNAGLHFRAAHRSGAVSSGTGAIAPVHRGLQAEHVEHRSGRHVLEFGRQWNRIVWLPRTHQDGDILLAVHRIADRRRIDAAADIEAPDFLESLGVVRREGAISFADEHQVAGRCQCARNVRIGELQGGPGFAGRRIDSLEAAVAAVGVFGAAAGKALARFDGAALVDEILLFDRLYDIATFPSWNVEQPEFRIVCGGLPVLAAAVGRAGMRRPLAAHAVAARRVYLNVGIRIVVERAAG